mmetsp:Transcript_1978/g.2074  ORF Transcript_1978/g.2074 Transcript_1978/m.2074 type:complete len:89 (+) Transcript_1978:1035-1301(+)
MKPRIRQMKTKMPGGATYFLYVSTSDKQKPTFRTPNPRTTKVPALHSSLAGKQVSSSHFTCPNKKSERKSIGSFIDMLFVACSRLLVF